MYDDAGLICNDGIADTAAMKLTISFVIYASASTIMGSQHLLTYPMRAHRMLQHWFQVCYLKAKAHVQCLSQELKKVRHMSHQAEKGETHVSPS